MEKNVIIIGIAGGTGSGKSTMIERIEKQFSSQITILSHDFYYKAHNQMTYDERCKLNYDHPDAFDTDLMIEHIKKLKQWQSIARPVYDFTIHNWVEETVTVYPAKVIVVEGILIFENKELLDLFDIKVFIDTDADVRIIRRIMRDVQERGRTLQSVVNQYLTTVKLMHEQFVEPSKKNADIIVPEGGYNLVALDMLNQRIHALLHDEDEIGGLTR
ncbi:uridine kinase [Emergencia timonensis]|uniref:uridine kinase n=1 Tax=Emergencia timonensis TaxID=1776384 RepID=UPI001D08CC86|nr:uridine kinase [Emergencia timonensis]MCB6477375.1 uridine kinase [Emergencia timonensis]